MSKKIELTEDELAAKIAEGVDAAVEGLKTKNAELLKELKTAKQGSKGISQEEFDRIESERDELKSQLSKTQKELTKAAKTQEELTAKLQAEAGFTEKLLKTDGLRAALTEARVAPHFMDAAVAMLQGQVQIVADGENRVAKVGDKVLADFVKEFAASDKGKHFVMADAGGGGGAGGGTKKAEQGKTVKRDEWNAMDHGARASFAKEGGKVVD